jgi:glycosidase
MGEQTDDVRNATGPDWVKDAVFYQVFPDRFRNGNVHNDPADVAAWDEAPTRANFFGGDLEGLTEKLGYLEELGVDALYLTPIFKAGTNHRYDTHDYFSVDPALGDAGILREFVQEAHARGIRVVLDGVFNHVGDGFWAFRDVLERGAASSYRDWFVIHDLPLVQDPPSYQTCGGAAYLPKLNNANPAVREQLLEVATYWIEHAGIDGWRLDVPWKVPLDFWHEFRARVKEAKPDAYLVGEAWWSCGKLRRVFDGLMNYRLRARLLDFCLFDSMDAEDLAYESALLLEETGGGEMMLNLLGSHDTPRLLTLADGDESRVALALVALFTYPGTPMLYYGDEVGLEGDDDPDCRRPMPWNEQAWRKNLQALVRRLIATRHRSSALRRGGWEPLLGFNRLLCFRRGDGRDSTVVVLNAGPAVRDVAIELPLDAPDEFDDALSGGRYTARDGRLILPAVEGRSALVLLPGGGYAA